MGQIVKPQSLHLQAYNILKQSILDGERKPSERIVESKIATTLGISRGPVREAIRMLIQDGLLEYKDNFVIVYEPTIKDIVEIFQCRQSLEMLAIKLTIENGEDGLVEALEENIRETEKALEDGPLLKQLDQQFHTIIINASQNNHLIQLLEMIKTKIHYMRNSMVKSTFYPTLINEHEKIVQAIRSKNIDEGTELIKEHIKKGLDGVLNQIQ